MSAGTETRPDSAVEPEARGPFFSSREKLIGLVLLAGFVSYVAVGVVVALADSTMRAGSTQLYSVMTFLIQVAAWPLLLWLHR